MTSPGFNIKLALWHSVLFDSIGNTHKERSYMYIWGQDITSSCHFNVMIHTYIISAWVTWTLKRDNIFHKPWKLHHIREDVTRVCPNVKNIYDGEHV